MANQPTKSSALATTENTKPTVHGTYRAPGAIAARLDYAMKNYNLVSPATSCGVLPEGFSLAIVLVPVDDIENDTYEVGNKRGLGKTMLDKIASAAGISWHPTMSRRLDDGQEAHFCSYLAVAILKDFDDRPRVHFATKEMDLRDGSPQVEALYERYQSKHKEWVAKGRVGREPKSPEGQIREMRLHIASHAETKAKLRAVRTLGIRSAYTVAELRKPFCVVRLQDTGDSDDPELKRQFAIEKYRAAQEASRRLYGDIQSNGQVPALPMLAGLAMPPSLPMPSSGQSKLISAPPIGSVPIDDDDVVEAVPPSAPSTTAAPAPAPQTAPSAPTTNGAQQRAETGISFKFGNAKGVDLADMSEKDLAFYAGCMQRDLDDSTKSKFHANASKNLAAIRAEQAYRSGGGSAGAAPPPPFDEFAGGGADDEIPFARVETRWDRP